MKKKMNLLANKCIALCFSITCVSFAHANIVVTGDVSPSVGGDPWVVGSALAIGADGVVQVTGGSAVDAGYGIEITSGGSFSLEGGELTFGSLLNPIAFDGSVSRLNLNAGKITTYGSFGNLPAITATSGGSGRVLDYLEVVLEGSNAEWAETSKDIYLGDALGTSATVTVKDSAVWNTSTATVVGYRGNGIINVDNASLVTGGTFYLGYLSGSSAQVNATNGASLTTNGSFYAGGSGSADVALTNSTWASNAEVVFANNNDATLTMSGGAWTANAAVTMADSGSFGATFSAGAEWTSADTVEIAVVSSSDATLALTGVGTQWTSEDAVTAGFSGDSEIQLADTAVWESQALVTLATESGSSSIVTIASNATWDAQGGIAFGAGTSAITLDGGNLNVGSDATPVEFLPTSSQFTFNTGSLILSETTSQVNYLTSLGSNRVLSVPGATVFGNNLNLNGGSLIFRGSADLSTANVTFTSGTLESQGTLTGLTSINASSTLRLKGSSGIWDCSASSVLSGNLVFDGGKFNVGTGSIFTALPGAGITFTDGTGGTIQMAGGIFNIASLTQLQLKANAKILGNGKIYGNIMVGTNGDQGLLLGTSSSNKLTIYGDLSGSGIVGNIRVFGNNAVGNSPGHQTWVGAYEMSPEATLTMEIGGFEPRVTYSQVTVGNADYWPLEDTIITLAGTLKIVFSEGYVPLESFNFLLFDIRESTTIAGSFSAFDLPVLEGLTWDYSAIYTAGILSMDIAAVPEVSQYAFCLGLISLIVVGLRRRKNVLHGMEKE
jgi:hypothetical protein